MYASVFLNLCNKLLKYRGTSPFIHALDLGPRLLTWINFNPSMDN